jgi:hypothetical protein
MAWRPLDPPLPVIVEGRKAVAMAYDDSNGAIRVPIATLASLLDECDESSVVVERDLYDPIDPSHFPKWGEGRG